MHTWLIHIWEKMRDSYWLVPGVMLVTVVALSYGLLELDRHVDLTQYPGFKWLSFSTTEGARSVLSTIAASTFSAATLTFSVTMVTLSLASSQFGPRLLRNFLRDPVNQFTFGAFIATFIYCLLTMRVLGTAGIGVLNLSISISIIMVLFDAVLFIAFIHHLTGSIQVERITAEIGREFIDAIESLFPEAYAPKEIPEDDDAVLNEASSIIRSDQFGYVQAINYQALISLAEKEAITIRLLFKPGHFILAGAPLVRIWPAIHLKSHIEKPIRFSFILGKKPSAEQDLEFTVRQMVQIAARALSPGINDPFTAMTCIDYLAAGLACIAGRNLPLSRVRNEDGRLLLIRHELSFQHICDACFINIRQMCRDNPPVVIYLLEILTQLAAIVQRQEDRQAVMQTAQVTFESAVGECKMDTDRDAIAERFENLKRMLEKNRGGLQDE